MNNFGVTWCIDCGLLCKDGKKIEFFFINEKKLFSPHMVAIFKIQYGKKSFLTKILDNGGFQEFDWGVKFSDNEVEKFPKEIAINLIKQNKSFSNKFGIVNQGGVQEII